MHHPGWCMFPGSVETIAHNAFDGCTSLREIHFKTIDIEQCTIDDNAFDGIEPQECTIYILQGEIAAYRNHPALGKFKIVEKLINQQNQ